MNNKTLENPTVVDIIDFLKSLPPNTKFRIEDADTMWAIKIIHIKFIKDIVYFYGQYDETGARDEQ